MVGSAWYEYMGQYKIKCCRTDRNKDQDDELPLAEVESENWTLVDSGSQPQRNDILGHWNTAKFDNGDYLIKIEVYDDIGRLHASGIITKDVDVDRHYPIVGRGKGQTLYFEEKSNIKVNWPGDFPFEFVRIYHHGLRKQPSPMWYGWTHNHNIKLMEDLTSDWAKNGSDPNLDKKGVGFGYVWLIMPTGTRMFKEYGNKPGDAEISYVPVDGEPDYIVRTTRPDTPGIFSLYYEHHVPDGSIMTFERHEFAVPASGVGWKLFAGIDRKTDRFGNYLQYSWKTKDLDGDGVYDDWYITQILAYRHFYPGGKELTNKCAGLFFDTWYSGGDTGIYACNPADPTPAIVLKAGEDGDRDGDLDDQDDQDLISIQREQATYTLTGSIAGTKYESTRWCMSGTPDTFVILDTYHWDNDNELKEARENPHNEDVLIDADHHWLHPSTEYEFYPNGELKTVRYCADWLVYGTITNVGDYSYEYDESGNLTTTVEYRIVGQSSPVSPSYSKQFVYKKDITTSTAKGAVLESKTISYQNPYVDPCDYGEFVAQIYVLAGSPLSYYAEGVHYSGGRLGGGGTSKTEYLYEDPNFPLKPTWIIETYDDDADGDYDGRSHRIKLAYDGNGNLTEKRDYVDLNYFVFTEYDYHDYYSGLKTRETTWQGLCYESGGSVVETGQKVETRYIYGDKGGNLAEEPQDANDIYLLKEIKLLEEGPDVEAETVLTYEDDLAGGKTNQVSSITDPEGNIDFYKYDERGFVKAVWKGATLTNGEPQGNPQKRYHYNEVGLCALEADYLGKVTERIYDDFGNVAVSNVYEEANPNSISLGFKYGGEFNPYTGDPNDTYHERYGGEFLSKTRYRGYNAYRKPASVDLPYGDYTNQLNYRDKVLETWIDHGSSYSSSHSSFSPGDNLQYYNHIKTMAADGVNFDKACTFLLYDSLSRPVHKYYAIADGDDNDAFTVLKHEEYAYDGAGNKTQEKVYALEGQGTYTSTLEKHTTYEYDLLKRMIKRTEDPDGLNLVTRYGYDATGNTIYAIDPEGHVAFVDYDNANRKIQEYFNEEAVYYTDDIIDIGATEYYAVVKTEYVYNDDDTVESVTRYDYDYDGDGEGGELAYTEFTYDGRGRIESVKEKIDDVPTYATTTIDYNDAGFDPCNGDYNNVCITDAVGQETYMSYEVHGKVDKISYPSNDYELMTYHDHGLLKTKTVWDDSGDPCLVEYEYDDFGKLKKKTYPDNGGYLEYEYTGRAFGKFGRVKKITDCRAAADQPAPAGRTFDSIIYEFEYNDPVSSRITSYTVDSNENDVRTLWYRIEYDYSRAYNKKTNIEAYDFDVATATTTLIYNVNYSYDMAGRLESVEAHNGTTGFDDIADCSYYPDGTRQQLTCFLDGTKTGDILDTSYEYNPDNALTRISALVGADSKYLFDAGASGNVDGLGRLNYAGEQLENTDDLTVTHASSFAYDMRSQLLTASISDINGGTWLGEYTYQKDGNIEEKEVNGQSDDFEYDTTVGGSKFDSDIMTKAGTEDLNWNDNGELKKKVQSNVDFVYNWDGKLRQAVIGTDIVDLKYDPMGNRVYKSVNSDPCEYIVDISGPLPTILCEIKASDSSLKKSYIYSNNGQIICQRNGGQSAAEYFYVNDRLGSVRQMIDSTGDVLRNYTYGPFGEAFSSECQTTSPVDDNPFMFTGQWYDSEIAQYYLRARMYDPQLMRFTARDPVRGKFNYPMALHVYLYCLNNPINRIDPMGEWSLPEKVTVWATKAVTMAQGAGAYIGKAYGFAKAVYFRAQMRAVAMWAIVNVFAYDLQMNGKINLPFFRGPEFHSFKFRGVLMEGWKALHFHLTWGPGLDKHHLPHQSVEWWKNLMNVLFH